MPVSEIEFEPTADPVAVLRGSADRLAEMDAQTARAAEQLALDREGGNTDGTDATS